MSFRVKKRFDNPVQSFNVTPLIDIIFLLMIFFLVVCRFIEAENFEVSVTDNCKYAQDSIQAPEQLTTVTVLKTDGEKVEFAVGSKKINFDKSSDIPAEIARLIDAGPVKLPNDRQTVVLRIDRDICFGDAQFALAGIAASRAIDIRLAVLKEKSAQ